LAISEAGRSLDKHDLLMAIEERVEGVEELFLRSFLAAEKLMSSINSRSAWR
jgi:hypothetical protein